jgi:RNA polymerase-binding transcription factor DksA
MASLEHRGNFCVGIEETMKKTELQQYRQQLLALRARCNGDVNQLTDEALRKNQDGTGNLSNMPIHMADVGSENFEQEFTLSLLENEEEVLKQIDSALDRIKKGTFGKCEECEGDIPKERLKILPHTPYCVACARKLEQRT